MEITSEKNKKEGVRRFWYPIEGTEPLPDEYYENVVWHLIPSNVSVKPKKDYYDRLLRRLGRSLGGPVLDMLFRMIAEDIHQPTNEKQMHKD